MHSAASSAENLNMIKYLLAQDVCRPMVLSKGKSPSRQLMSLPEDIARDLVVSPRCIPYMPTQSLISICMSMCRPTQSSI